MNALVKKEIRLLLPSWIAAMLLAMVQAVTRPYDFYVASLLFFGLTLMALTTIGREASLNTFSLLLAQPTERTRIWQTKLSVLSAAFLTVFVVWLLAFGIAFITSNNVNASDAASSYNLFITACLIATATFTGGLWTTLLLRQIAGAFWLTLLVPAVLSGFSAVFLAGSESDNLVIAVLSVVIGIYSVSGFLFARWLFFNAQDVGWSGGVIALPEWKIFARSENAVSTRVRKPIFALVKKEFYLQQVSLMGAVGLFVLHLSVIVLRKYHTYEKDSAGEILTSIFWMLWLVMAPVIGSMAVAEERRLGVMEGQLCLSVSRRVQFAIKAFVTLLLGIFLGGVLPMLLENFAAGIGAPNVMLRPENHPSDYGYGDGVFLFQLGVVVLAAQLTLGSLFASTLARNFLQAVGVGIAICVGLMLIVPVLSKGWMHSVEAFSVPSLLPLIIAAPMLVITLLWQGYLNFTSVRDGWPLWRRNLVSFFGVFIFVVISSSAIYNRSWEMLAPAEPAHGPAIFSLPRPPTLQQLNYGGLQVQLPDGRIWIKQLKVDRFENRYGRWEFLRRIFANPLALNGGPGKFSPGSNWVSVAAAYFSYPDNSAIVGIRADGSLWLARSNQLTSLSNETNWQQVARSSAGLLLLKKDATLWRYEDNQPLQPPIQPTPIEPGSRWQELATSFWSGIARKADGSVWRIGSGSRELTLQPLSRFDQADLRTLSANNGSAFVRPADGTLWISVFGREPEPSQSPTNTFHFSQVGQETAWRSVAVSRFMMVALKADGTLWQWNFNDEILGEAIHLAPTRLGIRNDWVALTSLDNGEVIALAADGSLWLWPDRKFYGAGGLLKLSKQPQPLGNVFDKVD